MKLSHLRSTLLLALALLVCILPLTACKATLKPGENGLYDSQSKISYSHASTVYEATELLREYGKLAVTDKESYKLYTIPGADPHQMLATEDYNIVYANGTVMPTLTEMAPSLIHVCVEGTDSLLALYHVEDAAVVASLANDYVNGEDLTYYPAVAPLRSYTVRFASTQYPGFYYTLTYLEYGEELTLDGVSYGKYFLRSAFDDRFVPVGDGIHNVLGRE